MKKIFLCFFSSLSILFANLPPLSTPEEIGALSSDADFLIGGIVSPLSGQVSVSKLDLIARGSENIPLSRTFIPAIFSKMPERPPLCDKKASRKTREKHYQKELAHYNNIELPWWRDLIEKSRGWVLLPHLYIAEMSSSFFRVPLSNGAVLHFSPTFSGFKLETPSFGMTNAYGDTPDPAQDLRNIWLERSGNELIIHAPDGTQFVYTIDDRKEYKKLQGVRHVWTLRKEILSNGKILRYSYGDFFKEKLSLRPKKIESLDPKEKHQYASILIDGSLFDSHCNYQSNTQDRVDYSLDFRKQTLICLVRMDDGAVLPEKTHFCFPAHMPSISSPSYRHESVSYNDWNQMTSYRDRSGDYSFDYEGSPYRITKLFRPCGEKGEMLPLYTIAYDSPIPGVKGGHTIATRIDNVKIRYDFDDRMLSTGIQWFSPKGFLKKEKLYTYDTDQRLKTVKIQDDTGKVLFQKEYDYDDFSNPYIEIIRGDLTGEGNEDVRSIKRTFSQDHRHLLLSEENEEGVVITWTYLKKTNLPTTQFTFVLGDLALRQFFEYDDCNNLILKLNDNGNGEAIDDLSGVTQRTAQRYHLKATEPFLHLPEWIEDLYWEGEDEKLLRKTHLEYDKRGNVATESVYDADGKFAYRIERTYDEQGNVRSETNALGETSIATFDAKGRMDYSLNGSKRLEKKMKYDSQGRLYHLEERGDKTISHITTYKYNSLDQPIRETDYFENETAYEYDPIASKPKKVTSSSIAAYNGSVAQVEASSTYDALAREISSTDANGFTTTKTYNFYGKPTLITYPDGTQETFTYFPNGNLKKAIDQEGHTTEYTYTPLGKLETKTKRSHRGEICEVETFAYEALQLKSSTDIGGHVTYYSYDGAGRRISEEKEGAVTEFTYDSLSRLSQTKKLNGEQTLHCITEYDLLNRKIQERQETPSQEILSQVFYRYDKDGNQSVISCWVKDKLVDELFSYDPFQRLVSQENGLSKRTLIEYNEQNRNSLNQRVLTKKKTDPMGLETIDIYDARGEIASTEKRLEFRLNFEQFYRDPCKNLTDQISTIYAERKPSRQVHTHWEYNSMHRLELLVEAYGTPDEKKTHSTYTPKGHLFETTKPDGVVLTRTYDAADRLKTISSSDGTISYLYSYTPDGEIEELKDLHTGMSTSRQYDFKGRLAKETLANGLELATPLYDSFDRRTLFVLPDHSFIEYSYDPIRLKTVFRQAQNQQKLYSHTYLKYDLGGHILEEKPIGNLGLVLFDYDLLARNREQSSPIVTYLVNEFDDNDNILELTTTDANGSGTSLYTYDDLSQIVSESGLFNNIYNFDSHNNRLKKNDADYQINDLNQLLSTDTEIYEYNLNGNPISKNDSQETYTYDALDRLTEITIKASKKISFTYDGFNRRLSKTVHTWENSWVNLWNPGWLLTSHELFLFDGQNEIGSANASGSIKELRILGQTPHAEIGAAIGMEFNGVVYTPLHDLHGNVAYLIKTATNKPSAAYRYSAFGEEKSTMAPQVQNHWRFSSKRIDDETGFIYYGRRYYNPKLGRWLTPDPAGFTDGMNLYAFVHNDPLTHFDEYGLLDYGQWSKERQNPSQADVFFSHCIHKFWNEARSMVSEWTGFQQYIPQTFGFLSARPPSWKDPMARGHQFIDRTLGTDLPFYREPRQESLWQIGLLPSPGSLMIPTANKVSGFARNFSGKEIFSINKRVFNKSELPKLGRGAENINAGEALRKKLSQLETAQQSALKVRLLNNGRIRYYGTEDLAFKIGPTRGRSYVTEFDTNSGRVRTWMECYNHSGKVNRVHPKQINGQDLNSFHYPLTAKELILYE